jgi:hypothetical protein
VQPDADPDAAVGVVPPVLLQALLDGDRAAQPVRRGGEGDHEAVAEEGRLVAAVRLHGPARDPLVVVKDLVGHPVRAPGPELGRPLHVGEQDRDRVAAALPWFAHGHPRWSRLDLECSSLPGGAGELQGGW